MKTLTLLLTLALAVTLLPAAFAQQSSSSQQPVASPQNPPAPDQNSASQATPGQDSNSFSGTVMKSGDKYVLKTDAGTYQLDDQDKAKQFRGKQVKVSGNLDKASSTLHITDIQPATNQ